MVSLMSRVLLVAFCLSLAACWSDMDENKVRTVAQSTPVRMDGEQAILTNQQVQCGVDEEL